MKNKTKNNLKSENRTKTIPVKVSPDEQEQIKKRAEEAGFGGKVSTYIRGQALRPDVSSSNGKLRQKIAALLCRHARMVQEMDEPVLRDYFTAWEVAVWQSIKS